MEERKEEEKRQQQQQQQKQQQQKQQKQQQQQQNCRNQKRIEKDTSLVTRAHGVKDLAVLGRVADVQQLAVRAWRPLAVDVERLAIDALSAKVDGAVRGPLAALGRRAVHN
jgi:transcription initiation factor TFIID subunit TAF12